jgi:hypothetical protein
MFAAEFENARTDTRRRSVRAPISLDAHIGKSVRTLCKVIDVSLHGVRLAVHSELKRGSTIWLMLPDIGHVAADVRWSDDFSAGCEFHNPLDQATLDGLLAKSSAHDRG